MKWFCAGVLAAFSCLSLAAAATGTHAAAHKASQRVRRSSSPKSASLKSTSHSSERAQAKLQTASFRPANVPQSSSSSASPNASRQKKSGKRKRPASRREPTQMSPTPERISEIQSALGRGGYYQTDPPTGKWDSDTVDALQRFQSSNGLDTTGKLDALTLQKLGLGSDVAGVSAPKGIVSHSCCSMSPSPSQAPRLPAASQQPSGSTSSGSAPSPVATAAPNGLAEGSSSTAAPQDSSH
jgi:peptidoglycan hydrolase-like protein with peptidoglycan-binding domain